MSALATSPADRVAATYAAVIDAHERLVEAVADSVRADRELSAQERRRWKRWAATATADLAELRRNSPFAAGGSA